MKQYIRNKYVSWRLKETHMKQRIHREKMLFTWFTQNHEIVVGFKTVQHGICQQCGKNIPSGNTLCDACFAKDKEISTK